MVLGNCNNSSNPSHTQKEKLIISNSVFLYQNSKTFYILQRKKQNDFLNLASLYIPTYQITTSKVPVAIIFAPGKQLLVRKLPAREKYFVDPDWGLFEIKPEYVQFMNKTPVYFFDTRNQNPFSPTLMAEMYRWAERNQITKLTRKHISQGIRLRKMNSEQIKEEDKKQLEAMTISIRTLEKEISEHNKKVQTLQENEDASNLEGQSGELAEITEIQTNFLIVKQLALESYITKEEAIILEDKLKNKSLSFEEMIDYLKETKLMEVSEALPHGLDLIADNFHTYEPKDAITIIKMLSKLNKGFKGLRTTKPKNWFPATYLLFGAIGIMILMQFLGEDGGGLDNLLGGFQFLAP